MSNITNVNPKEIIMSDIISAISNYARLARDVQAKMRKLRIEDNNEDFFNLETESRLTKEDLYQSKDILLSLYSPTHYEKVSRPTTKKVFKELFFDPEDKYNESGEIDFYKHYSEGTMSSYYEIAENPEWTAIKDNCRIISSGCYYNYDIEEDLEYVIVEDFSETQDQYFAVYEIADKKSYKLIDEYELNSELEIVETEPFRSDFNEQTRHLNINKINEIVESIKNDTFTFDMIDETIYINEKTANIQLLSLILLDNTKIASKEDMLNELNIKINESLNNEESLVDFIDIEENSKLTIIAERFVNDFIDKILANLSHLYEFCSEGLGIPFMLHFHADGLKDVLDDEIFEIEFNDSLYFADYIEKLKNRLSA